MATQAKERHAEQPAASREARGIAPSAIDPATLIDNIDDLLTVLDREGRIVFQNAASVRWLGLAPGALIGRHFANWIPTAHRTRFLDNFERLTAGDARGFPAEIRLMGPDSNARRFEASARTIQTADGATVFVLVSRDLGQAVGYTVQTNLQRTGNALGQCRLQRDGTVSLSPDLCRFYGAEHETIANPFQLLHERNHPEDAAQIDAVFRTAFIRNQSFVHRSRVRDGRGVFRNVQTHGSPELSSDGRVIAILVSMYDISEQVETEAALHRSELEYRHVLEIASDVFSRLDRETRCIFISPTVERLLGYSAEEIVGRRAFSRYIHPDERELVEGTFQRLRDGTEKITLPHRLQHRDGHLVWLESTLYVVRRGQDGVPEEIAVVTRDITERKRAEDALALARERAEAASATKSRFLANMSHEFRTPLNAIIGFSDIMRRELFGPVGSSRYQEYARLILESGGHLLDLINDILDMSKIEAGKFELRLEDIDLEELVQSCLKLVEARAQEASLVLHAKFCDQRPLVRADRRALKQILLNLLSNAIKFTPAGGLVATSVERVDNAVTIEVSDTGVGISEDDLKRVTQPFEQATDDPLLAKAGTGLGLALVQSLTSLHKGTLKIDSEVGRGTSVTIMLPQDPNAAKSAA